MNPISYVANFEDVYDPPNGSIDSNLTSYIVEPGVLPCEALQLVSSVAVALCLIQIGIFLLAIPGNLLVGLVIASKWQTLTPSEMYLFHLTVADGLLALTLPFWAVSAIHGWIFGDFLCKALNLCIEANFYTSILFLACISVDRYVVIVHAHEANKDRHRSYSRVVCASVWVLGCALALPALFNDAFKPEYESNRVICYERYDIGSAISWRLTVRGVRHVVGFVLPLVVMVTCYSITIVKLLHTRGFQKHRAMQVIVVVVLAFLLCWTPYHLVLMTDTLLRAGMVTFNCSVRRSVNLALHVTHSVALVHSFVNPVLYAFVGQKFRKNLGRLIQRKMRQDRNSMSRFSRSTSQTSEGNGSLL
ncbi:C-X-C chemokine receptor type 2-like [Lampris incognitus]|uniref:C-X-C chemokine receptor type 2-like n=1 Tax=Lampris incognitus TaxID=2546036 RepID=UPI0024B623A3|nr:C-X-C chemokine receptor type 2-like [Lampris incognitus]